MGEGGGSGCQVVAPPTEVKKAQVNAQSSPKHHSTYTRLNECLDSNHIEDSSRHNHTHVTLETLAGSIIDHCTILPQLDNRQTPSVKLHSPTGRCITILPFSISLFTFQPLYHLLILVIKLW